MYDELYVYFSEHLLDNSFISWLCLHNNEIIATSGICFYYIPPSHSNITGSTGYIMNMFTKKEFRCKGIAKKLFVKMVDEGKKRNVGKLVLHATPDGEQLYKHFRFSMSGNEMILSL